MCPPPEVTSPSVTVCSVTGSLYLLLHSIVSPFSLSPPQTALTLFHRVCESVSRISFSLTEDMKM